MPVTLGGGVVGAAPIKGEFKNLNPLEGILDHIHQVKDFSDWRKPLDKKKDPTARFGGLPPISPGSENSRTGSSRARSVS